MRKEYRIFIILSLISQGLCEYGSPCTTTDNVAGICVPVKSCKPAFDFFAQLRESGRVITFSEREEIQSLHCGTFRGVAHICCDPSKLQLNPDGVSLLEKQKCGIYLTNRVTYGYEAKLMGYPWMALLVYDDERDPYKCGGSLISEQHVLTAAHCVRGRESSIMYVRLGEHRKSTAIDCVKLGPKTTCAPEPLEVGIQDFILHENYRSVYNDIALLRLERKVAPDVHIKPICLPIYENLRSLEHEQYVISGWGRTETGASSDVLRVAIVPHVDVATCQNYLRPFGLTYQLNSTHICAGAKNLVDTCKGDSGGPLGYTDIYNGSSRFVQYGVVSVGVSNCGERNVPGIYANVSHYMQWITDHIHEDDTIPKTTVGPTKTPETTEINSRSPEEPCLTPLNSSGFCVPYSKCSLFQQWDIKYGGNLPPTIQEYIKRAQCSKTDDNLILYCCEPETIVTAPIKERSGNGLNLYLNPMQDFHSQLNVEGFDILSGQRCGTDNGNRIAGGNITMLAEFPWMALLIYQGPSGEEFRCGGSLITNRYVLTAAHCLRIAYPLIGVRLGEYNTSTEEDCMKMGPKLKCNPPAETFGVETTILHPEYNRRERVNDIALIKLDRNVEFKKHIEPICLPIYSNIVWTQTDDDFLIAGWGYMEDGHASNVLLKAQIKQLPINKCSEAYSIDASKFRYLCAGDEELGRDTCRGDSGGPLIQFAPYNNRRRFIQYGVVAIGRNACKLTSTLPGAYTHVSYYMPWITNNIVN
ncbi:uncharacterized protein LOC131806374 [Musca domestica]|uniref:Uncharacterized protein LOC131806374 n=1 Tax=Musca domestica TaxID=7370 RepID=A0ABM3VKU0_MUSDO|nr:uncharacterized protein LOC131806374 [Musca domestica]XP_058986475.1 uncharacterized protein LOC131806374 [Musca domestica]XP_058986502.1 uncharacterized protein LOC131806374 [Musca domestica]XP_058986534.1 uncharacterized protein LOC131806374 [Musca domestica]